MKVTDLREARALKVTEMRAMLAKAEQEKRSLSADETARFDALKGEVQTLEGDEQRAQFMADMERRAAGDPVDKFAKALEQRVSVVDTLNAQIEGRSLEGAAAEYSREVELRTGKRGVFVPLSAFESRAQTTTTAAPIVPEDFRADQFVGPLRNSLVMRSLGARVLTGLRGDVVIPRHKTSMTAGWIAEGESLSESGMTFDTIGLKPRHVGALTELSRQLLQQSSPSIEQLVRDDLSAIMAEAFDTAMLNGDGVKEPLGLLKTPGIQTNAMTAPTWAGINAMLQQLALKNVTPNAWLSSPQVATALRTTLKAASAGSAYLMEGGQIAGIGAAITNQVPLNTTKGQLILGDFSEMIVGVWDSVELLVNPYAEAPYKRGGVLVRAIMTADAALRRPEAFVLANSVTVA